MTRPLNTYTRISVEVGISKGSKNMNSLSKKLLSGHPFYWVTAGILMAMTGLGLDFAAVGGLQGSPMTWGFLGASVGAVVGLLALVRYAFTQSTTHKTM